MKETTKSNRRRRAEETTGEFRWNDVFSGHAIDIGGGDDPLRAGDFPSLKSVRLFDIQHGDANIITKWVREPFDVVYSSQCLEHMHNPPGTLFLWWSLVKPGGWMVITVPDEDLYEQGVWPSNKNTDHKWTFRTTKRSKWSHRSIRVQPLIEMLPMVDTYNCKTVDTNYDHSLTGVDQTLGDAEAWIEFVVRKEANQ